MPTKHNKQLRKINVGARQEGVKPKRPVLDRVSGKPQTPDHLLPRIKGHGTEFPAKHGGVLGPRKELKKEPTSSSVKKLHQSLNKEDGGGDGGGALSGGGTVFTSTNSGIFNPTYGGNKDKPKKKKKTGIERLGQFITDNSPEKKMVKSSVINLTDLVNSVRLELRKEDEKKQTLPHSKATQSDPPQVIERGSDLPNDPNLVAGQKMTENDQKRIMDEAKTEDREDPNKLSKKWQSGRADINPFHRGGAKDTIEDDEDRTEPEKPKLPFNKRLEKLLNEDT